VFVAASPLTISAGGWRKYVDEAVPPRKKGVRPNVRELVPDVHG